MRSLDPACKFVGLLVPTFFLAAFSDPFWNLVFFALCFLGLCLSKVNLKVFAGVMAPVLLMAFAMFMTGYHFPAQGNLPSMPKACISARRQYITGC